MPELTALWARLEAFTVGDPDAELGFARRLARENRWSAAFAERVVGEYKRFVYLAMEAGHPVTPSDEVDQAWHLHLLYTESYWHDLCRDLLGRPLHHGPTRGGEAEGAKFRDWYGTTLDSYRSHFGETPPPDIWPPSERRFGIAPYFRRINTAEHFVIPRRAVAGRARLAAAACLAFGLAGCATVLAQGDGGGVGAVVITVIALVLMVLVLTSIRPGGADRKKRDSDSGCNGLFGGSGCAFGGDSGCGGCGGCGS